MVKSMTGFARMQNEGEWGTVVWEIKAVNGRYLDMCFRLPEVFHELEPVLREKIKQQISRGRVECTACYQAPITANAAMQVNVDVMNELLAMTQSVQTVFTQAAQPSVSDILRWPGVVEALEMDKKKLHEYAIQLFEQALEQFNSTRNREGTQLKEYIESRLISVSQQVTQVEQEMPAIIKKHRDMILGRFEEMKVSVDPERLEQEMVMLAQRLDVAEEINRIQTHVTEVTRVLSDDEIMGRRLDFLMQELNREVNTLGSKSCHELTSHAAVELKVLIEQMREQVQNIE